MLGRLRRAGADDRGFTLAEVLIVIVLMGIVFAIAASTWFGVVRSRSVDSATNQVAADLRAVHSQATNRLADYSFVVAAANSSTYQVGPSGGTLVTKDLPGGTQIEAAVTIVFKSDGSAQITGTTPIKVRSSADATNFHTIGINPTTSEIKVVP